MKFRRKPCNLCQNIKSTVNCTEVDDNLQTFCDIVDDICSPLFKQDINDKKGEKS